MILIRKNSWLRTLVSFRGSTIVHTWPRLLLATAIAVVVTWAHFEHALLSEHHLTTTPFTLIALALGIFLGFRNNTSYDRFWEGRKLWGAVVNYTRTLTRQTLTMVRSSEDDVTIFQQEIVRRVMAYAHALRMHLRDERDFEELNAFLDQEEVSALADEVNPPIAILQKLGDRFAMAHDRGWIHPMHWPVLEGSLTALTDVQGGCERIKATPIPFIYNILMHRIVAVYCFALPFGLVESVGMFTPVVVALVSYAFFGLDAVGDEIEDPFGLHPNDLPLTAITRMIEVNLRQRLGETELPPLLEPIDCVLS